MRRRGGGGGREGAKDEREEEEARGEAWGGGAKMTTMGKQVTRAGHDTPNTSTIASKLVWCTAHTNPVRLQLVAPCLSTSVARHPPP